MNLTTEQKKHCAAVRTAAANGEKCQWQDSSGAWWTSDPFDNPKDWEVSPERIPDRWRIAPKKVVRPWAGPDDVPGTVCWVRNVGDDACEMITAVFQTGVGRGDNRAHLIRWDAMSKMEHSTDRKTWKACVIEEDQQ